MRASSRNRVDRSLSAGGVLVLTLALSAGPSFAGSPMMIDDSGPVASTHAPSKPSTAAAKSDSTKTNHAAPAKPGVVSAKTAPGKPARKPASKAPSPASNMAHAATPPSTKASAPAPQNPMLHAASVVPAGPRGAVTLTPAKPTTPVPMGIPVAPGSKLAAGTSGKPSS